MTCGRCMPNVPGLVSRALVGILCCLVAQAGLARADQLDLREGDHVCIVGGGLADAMQHTGWLEALLHSRFPGHRLTIRNLGFDGDEIDPAKRLRSAHFGTPDQWLSGSAPIPKPAALASKEHVRENRFESTNTKADVIFAFFGSNEAHAGPEGLAAFKAQVDAFITHTLGQKYDGVESPKLVMFSPIAHEDLARPHWPDGSAHNANLAIYTDALEEVCAQRGVVCVDLFTPTTEAYAKIKEPLTEDGIHPNERGDREISRIIDESLFGAAPARDPRSLARLQKAVADKNRLWFQRYRATDGYSVFGERAFLKFEPDQQSNYEVGQRELEYIDVMTANRDRRIWATAATLADPAAPLPPVEEVGLPKLLAVKTNKPGPLEGGRHEFLSGADAIGRMTVHSGMRVELVADEVRFPELINPVQMSFDAKGRLWVATWPNYPHWKPDEAMDDKLLILEDVDGDGKTDTVTTFAGDLHNPTGFEFWGKGVMVAQGPDVLYLEDTDGDDRYDVKRRIIHGLDTADTHHAANSFAFDPSGSLYFQEGTFHHSQPETPWGPPVRVANGAVFRYEPRTGRIALYTSYEFANPHGHAFGRWGDDIVVDGTMAAPFWGSVFSSRLNGLDKHTAAPTVYAQRTRPCPGIEIVSGGHFPPEMEGQLLVGNVIGFQGILRYAFNPGSDSFPVAVEAEPIVSSSDPNFRPADLEIGPDGALYFTDWQNPIIGHMQHNLRDPSRDRIHGRVYRVVVADRPLVKSPPIAGQPVAKLVPLLADRADRVRYRARIELAGRPEAEVLPAVRAWLADLDPAAADYEHHQLEALWMLRHFDQVDLPLLGKVLESRDARARTAGLRVLSTIVERVPESLEWVRKAAADEDPRVRLEAVRTATFLTAPEAVEVLALVEQFPSDRFLKYVTKEAARVLHPQWRARPAGTALTTEIGRRYVLRLLTNDELVREAPSVDVYREMLLRNGLEEKYRRLAVEELAKADKTSVVKVVADALAAVDRQEGEVDPNTIYELIRLLLDQPPAEVAAFRGDMERFATSARRPAMRRVGYVAVMAVDAAGGGNATAKAWELAQGDSARMIDLIGALSMVSDPAARASLYERLLPLVELPAGGQPQASGLPCRYVRVQIFGTTRTLTLAEVEVFSGGVNVALGGTASQKNTAEGGVAGRAIDGNPDPDFQKGSQTHSEPGTNDPWWEVDLGTPRIVERVMIHNRQGALGTRLKEFKITVLDGDRKEVFMAENQPAPELTAEFEMAPKPEMLAVAVRRAAFAALAGVRGRERETFEKLAPYVRSGVDRDAAIRALATIPISAWPADQAEPLLDALTGAMKAATAAERASDSGLAAWQFAENLTTLLPPAEGKARRAVLADLGVRVVRIGTVYERMAYDQETVAVQAGRPVLFVLENADTMPHNFVITKPGRMQAVGEQAEQEAQRPEFAKQGFVPASPDVLAASTLMQPQASQRVAFTAPTEPGVYPYVCTYPGHWRRMFGALYVVDDLESYLADSKAYLAAHPLPIKDALLEDRRPRTAWALSDLEDSLASLEKGRSFLHGRELFRTASCISCHKIGDAGNAFGPELSKLDAAMTPVEIARHILEPSLRIEEKYRATTILTDDGRAVTGLVVEETPNEVAIVENPLAKADPLRIPRAEIEERTTSPVSIMPKGLLDKLSRDEVLDLIAYVAARGQESSSLFSPDGCPHHEPAPSVKP